MPAPELHPLAAEYLQHEGEIRRLYGVDGGTIQGSVAEAALSGMLSCLQRALRDVETLTDQLQEALDELQQADRYGDAPAAPEPPREPSVGRCQSISAPVDYLDLGRQRTSRIRCMKPDGHAGEHAGMRGDGREHPWS